MSDDILEDNEEPLAPSHQLTPEQEDERLWLANNEWPSDPHYQPYRWAFDELERIFGKGKVAIGDCDSGCRIGAGVKMRFSNGIVVRSAIYLKFPPRSDDEKGFDLNSLDRDDALVWLRIEARLVRVRGSHSAHREWLDRHPEED